VSTSSGGRIAVTETEARPGCAATVRRLHAATPARTPALKRRRRAKTAGSVSAARRSSAARRPWRTGAGGPGGEAAHLVRRQQRAHVEAGARAACRLGGGHRLGRKRENAEAGGAHQALPGTRGKLPAANFRTGLRRRPSGSGSRGCAARCDGRRPGAHRRL
jgi:hypothetical protein